MKRRKRVSQKKRRQPSATPSANLSKSTENIIKYWRQCLIDAQRMEIPGKEVREQGTEFPLANIAAGTCPAEVAEALHQKKQAKRQTSGSYIDVIIAPLGFTWAGQGNPRRLGMTRSFESFWIPAQLKPSGTLSPPRGRAAWIPRQLLEPTPRGESLAIGEAEAVQTFTRKNPISEITSWKDYWNWCNRFFKTITGKKISDFHLADYKKRRHPVALIDTGSSGGNRQALKIYEQILFGKRPPGLLLKLATLQEPKANYHKASINKLTSATLRHYGQIEHSFPLSSSQRKAVHEFSRTPSGQILTVTGPPGTGKTTLLQSIIASTWVNAARTKNTTPPLIVACAGTNQAITNIVDSFAKASTRPGPLAGRWLPKVVSYGCYCPSEMKAEGVSHIPIERTTGEGFSREIENWEYLSNAKQKFLEHFKQYTGQTQKLKKAVSILQQEMNEEIVSIHREVKLAAYGTATEWLQSLIGLRQKTSHEQLEKLLNEIDVTHRHKAFQLATHYWEGRWLLETEKFLSQKKLSSQKNNFRRSYQDWTRRAMLTPCFVSTLAMTPRFFSETNNEKTPDIDILIVDEASQVLPEEGAASFALAKRALVVGDTEQLEPVRNIPEYVDIENLKKFKLLKKRAPEEFISLRPRCLTTSHGSLMLHSQSICRFREENTIGVFLSEHRRSVPGVIAYCNKLAYHGRLEPKRAALPDSIFPPIGYIDIPGSSQMVGSSRENVQEAEKIKTWLMAYQKTIEKAYRGEPLEDLLAVITPFAAQKQRLESLLKIHYPQMTIGTVHGLQGAERRIVIFSPVYDSRTKVHYFFDRNLQMLNVAVSRAQDAFLVFGDMAIFNPAAIDDNKTPTPSAVLAQFLFQNERNRLRDSPLPSD